MKHFEMHVTMDTDIESEAISRVRCEPPNISRSVMGTLLIAIFLALKENAAEDFDLREFVEDVLDQTENQRPVKMPTN